MSEIQKESGYSKASTSAKPLSGDVPVMDWGKGDLKKLFATPTAPVQTKAELAPREMARETTRETALKTAEQKPTLPEPPAAHNPIELKPAAAAMTPLKSFTLPSSVVAAGGRLAPLLSEAAHEEPDHDVAKLQQLGVGGIAGLNTRWEKERRKETLEASSAGSSKRDPMLEYMVQQQQQAFMRSIEYSTALRTTRECIRKNKEQLDIVDKEVAIHREEKVRTLAAVAESTGKVEKLETQEEAAVKLEVAQDIHAGNVAEHNEASTDLNKVEGKLKVLPTVKIIPGVNETYYQRQENGAEVTYRVGQDGIAQKIKPEEISAEALCNAPLATYIKTMPDGSTQYVNEHDRPLDQNRADNLKKFMGSTGQNPESLAKAEQAQELHQQKSEKLNKVIEKADSASQSEVAVETAKQEAMATGIPPEKLKDIKLFLTETGEHLNVARQQLNEDIKKDNYVGDKLAAKIEEQKHLRDDGKELRKFEKDLDSGKFRNEEEMLKAMPESMKKRYETNKVIEKNNNPASTAQATSVPATPTQTITAAADNTSRTNGSAAAPIVTTSTTLGPPFGVAAAGTPATNPSTPATPAVPDDLVARAQPVTAPGMRSF